MRQRLLAIDVLAQFHGRGRDDGVRMVGHGDIDGIEALLLFEKLAKILITFGGGKVLFQVVNRARIDIAQGDEVFRRAPLRVTAALSRVADLRDVQPAVQILSAQQIRARQNRPRHAGCCGLVADDDERGRLGAALRHAEQGTHAEAFEVAALEHLALDPLFPGHLARGGGHFQRRKEVGRLVRQRAREVLGRRQHLAAQHRGVELAAPFGHTTANESNAALSLPVLWRSGSKSPRMAPSTAAEANSAPVRFPSSSTATDNTFFFFRKRTEAATSLRNSAESKPFGLSAGARQQHARGGGSVGGLLAFLLGGTWLLAGEKGQVMGTVAGPSQAPIPGARVALTAADGSRQFFVADQSGHYSFPSVEPGAYTLSAEAAGYQAATQNAVQAAGGASTTVNLHLVATAAPGAAPEPPSLRCTPAITMTPP